MRRTSAVSVKVAGAAVLAVCLGLGVAPSAYAGSGVGGATGGDVSGPGDQVGDRDRAQALAKMDGVAAWWTVGSGYLSHRSRTAAAAALTAPTVGSVYLSVKHYAQIKSYYCGPAAGKMILENLHAGRSAFNGVTQTQGHIGGPAHMETDKYGATKWAKGQFRRGLNRWLSGKVDGFYVRTASPSVSEYKKALARDVQQRRHPFGNDTVEKAGGIHYNSHPRNQTIGHWIVTAAFLDHGATTRFQDPSTSVWSAPKPTFNYNTKNFVNRFLQDNGITW